MNIERLMKQLELDEGKRLRVYLDHLGNPTVGIGHLIQESSPEYLKSAKVGDKITEEQCKELFIADLANAIQDAIIIFGEKWDSFPVEAQEVFVNMAFNLGRSGLMKFKKTIFYAYNHDWENVAKEMMDSRWAKQVPNRAAKLKAKIERLA